ncbi:MAG TPA: AI-2E family transporter [Bryobacteraceae bacterium]|nr:AI-2E family transporter [Bryobacteraceae bacterium]
MPTQPGWFTRERLSAITLLAVTAISIYLCYLLIVPFLSALAWALAFAVISMPLHLWLEKRMKPAIAAVLTCSVIVIALAGPVALVSRQMVKEAAEGAQALKEETEDGQWREKLRSNAWTRPVLDFLEQNVDFSAQLERAAGGLANGAKTVLAGSFSAIMQVVIAIFILFFILRDHRQALASIRSMMPMEREESSHVIVRVGDTVYATVYGRIAIAFVQALLGGGMFAILGVPAPVLWGAVMFVASMIPVLGAFSVWGPAALYLALTGSWGKALILTVFGTAVISVIDNVLYPILVGQKMRLHTVPMFFSLVGGIALLGASGIILGPVIVAVTTALIDVWVGRTVNGGSAEKAS